ncbi:MAG: pyridoxal-dependent decarboxylase [Burkholderiales bacterium]
MTNELRLHIGRPRAAMQSLEPDDDEREALGRRALDHALDYLKEIPDAPSNRPWSAVFSQRLEPEYAEQGRDPAAVLKYVATCVDRPGFATTSRRFLAYIPGGGLFHSALGDMLAAVSNKYSGFASASPCAVRLENVTTDWRAEVIGHPKSAAGTLTSGGSVANLADSVALDPHKTRFLPYGSGAVLVRNGRHLFHAFGASAEYIRPLGESAVGPSPADLSIELTRHFRALRLWLPLQIAGASAFQAAQAEKAGARPLLSCAARNRRVRCRSTA